MSQHEHSHAPASPIAWSRWLPVIWVLALTLLLLGPALGYGFVLRADMVFTPTQSLLPWMLGVDGGLPRAVPQDAVVATLAGPLPGMLIQKIVLLAIPLVGGLGVCRVLRKEPWFTRIAAASLFVWSPYLAQRLLIGHWALLLTFAVTPWVLASLTSFRSGRRIAAAELVVWVSLGSLVPTGSLFMAILVLPLALTARRQVWGYRLIPVVGVVLAAATWLVPTLTNPNVAFNDPLANELFATRSENWAGVVGSALSGGGIWNATSTLPSRSLPWVPVLGILVVVLAVLGLKPLAKMAGRAVAYWVACLACGGLTVAVFASLAAQADWWLTVTGAVPGWGLLRDGQKLLLPLTVLLALAAPLGLMRVARSLANRSVRVPVVLALALLPLALMPDLALGALGRLQPASYPASWDDVRAAIASGQPGEAISLPWSTFRRYQWNAGRPVLDPSPRYMTTTVVTDDRLPVGTSNGTKLVVGDNPSSARVAAALASGKPLQETMPELGVRWVIEQLDQPGSVSAEQLVGLRLVVDSPQLRLWEMPEKVNTASAALPASVVAVNAAFGLGFVTCVILIVVVWMSSRLRR